MCSCWLFFSLPLIFTLVAASISPFFKNSYVFLPTKVVSFVFCLALALSLLLTSMKTLKLSQNKGSTLLLLFLSLKVIEAMWFTAKTRGCLKWKISSRLTWGGECTYGRFSQNQNFLDASVTKFSYPWFSTALVRAPLSGILRLL